jgi:DeoR/GlpR family transcriptional regulator of sugar metabolism
MVEDGEAAPGQRLIAEERQRRIEELLRRQAIASVAEVMEVTGASEPTTRRDLALLERLGMLARTRGGARAVQRHSTLEEEFEIRRSRDRREKRLIGQCAAGLIEDGMTLFITDGTTSFALAQCLVHRHLTVITGALNIAQLLAGSAGIEVIVVGGQLRATSFGTTGPLSVDTIRSLHTDLALIAPDGVTLEGGVRTFSLDDAASARAMSESSERTIVLASPAKVGHSARARVIGWSRVDAFVAASLPGEFMKGLQQQGVSVMEAE